MRRKIAAGNWKMNGTAAELSEIAVLARAHSASDCEILICPPATLLHRMSAATHGTAIRTGGQDCHAAVSGAHTGDIAAAMLADAGASAVILGHSERRTDHGETDDGIRAKANAAFEAGLQAILCVGETETQRDAANTLEVIANQMARAVPDGATGENIVIAYEPVWAIGTGRVPARDQIGDVHDLIRSRLNDRFGAQIGHSVRILYGGSVKSSNAAEIFSIPNVDGALVGGASLRADDFSSIISALNTA
ncbi:MAG: triose-phosphate isomerase [Pseudomonadota bacterium]